MYEVTVEGRFAAAHNLRGYRGDCERLHGHNWRVRASVRTEQVAADGMAVDFRDLKRALEAVLDELDHRYLNADVPAFAEGRANPTTENLARVIFERLSASGRLPAKARVERVTVWESPGCSASFFQD